MMPMAGVVIVSYNSGYCVGRCLDACIEQGVANIVLVDNASQDNTVEEANRRHGVRVIANATNRGFAAAVNQGVENLDEQAVLILNPDTVIGKGIHDLEMALRPDTVGAAT